MTENGADTALLWNPDLYYSFCPMVLDRSTCMVGFAMLSDYQQAVLKWALLEKLNASCPICQNKIDTAKSTYSIHVFAETLKANCAQVDQLISNTTGKTSNLETNYTDLCR